MSFAKSFTELKVWQEGHKLVLDVYRVSESFPKSEVFGLSSQLRRSASSVTANITEGFERGTKKELHQFLMIARGSLGETQNHLLLARDLKYLVEADFQRLAKQAVSVHKLLNAFSRSVKPANQRTSVPAHHA